MTPATVARSKRKTTAFRCLFIDIGGVLLTDGWGQEFREAAAKTFGLDLDELEIRHHLVFDTYEVGKFSLADYLNLVVFHQNREFSRARFLDYMLALSKPFPEMISLVKTLKASYGLKIIVVSNEALELNNHRIRAFKLDQFVDSFISSCYVHLRKPDPDIFRLALDTAQVSPEQVLYIDNTPMFVAVAAGLGIRGILHKNHESTRRQLTLRGLRTGKA